ncbi:GNAT family N-acetyltransferase [Sulfitobacter donghicola]|uniref:GNAT family acetyltransferase n=1 Tax=Sulfitobacter donghicola DSW-25 = KCTC 12864 = JCM 14565 TaxID=1300350 RepID=A0A073IJL0_9RHOB|nr:GNAT family N-acetyltransferase [Sulfitobacter donghicola]KEJ90493.1 GNAT family acetyltransferase [Sulfitobacter donghicola DSW-25 = KCTC 12864 = JCM 14565]KIN67733.1 Acetyltransferase [Sulfitobacter donghicola DSW-25 = KCTC 12864 = JCM 14565]
MIIRDLIADDFPDALRLYQVLTRDPVPVTTDPAAFHAVLDHAGTTIVGAQIEDRIVAMITLHILPNMTSGGRAYALVENVICDPEHQGKGIGKAVLQAGLDKAKAKGCYKAMLLTGEARGARGFYESLGFSGHEKHGMILRF